MVIGINQDGYRVDRANWRIFYGLASLLPTLNGDGLPAVAFRCAVTVTAVTSHTDCAGSVTIGTETLAFLVSGQRKTTTVLLSALPVPSATGLDCNILIEAITSGGANILHETQAVLKTRFMQAQKEFVDSSGNWSRSAAIADTTDPTCNIDDVFSFGGQDYDIAQVQTYPGLGGAECYRRLYLTGERVAPLGRAVIAPVGTEVYWAATYDADNNGVVDLAEGIREVTDFPTAPKVGDMVLKDGKVYIATE